MGFADRWCHDQVLHILRKLEPDRKFPENFSGGRNPNNIEGRDEAEEWLRQLGRPGWTTLEESIGGLVEDLRKFGA